MYLVRVAPIAAAALGVAFCQNDVRLAPPHFNATQPTSSLVPRDCVPCGSQQETCCIVGQTCAFSDEGDAICIPDLVATSNASTFSASMASVPDIARSDTDQNTTTAGDAIGPFTTYSTSIAATTATEITEASDARATDSTSFETATTTYTLAGPLPPLETINVDQGQDYQARSLGLQHWCSDQTSTCPLLCGGEPAANECYTPEDLNADDPTDLDVTCICADGSVPDRATYIHTLENYICEQEREDCITKLLSVGNFTQNDQDVCFDQTCGKIEVRVAPFNTTALPAMADSKPNALITAQSTTINIPYLGWNNSNYGASVVAVNDTTTTIRVQCDYNSPDVDCGQAMPTITLTMEPVAYDLYGANGSALAFSQGCSWLSASGGECTGSTVTLPTSGVAASTMTPEVSVITFVYTDGLAGSFAPIRVTAGAYKLVQNAQTTASGSGGDGAGDDGGTNVSVDDPDTKTNTGVCAEVGVSATLVTLILMLVLAL